MNYYSQNEEQNVILDFFKSVDKGRFLDIGAYTGKELSNTRALFEKGWSGVLVEPSPQCFVALMKNYEGDDRCALVNAALGTVHKLDDFHDSGGAVATTDAAHFERWKDYQKDFRKIYVPIIHPLTLLEKLPGPYDFISIDTEGCDLAILRELDLDALKTTMVCVEYGSDLDAIQSLLKGFGFREIYRCGENIIAIKT